VKQLEVTTTATQAIQSRFSGEAWDKQQQWQLKRDLFYDLLRTVNEFQDTMRKLCILGPHPDKNADEADTSAWMRKYSPALERLKELYEKICDLKFMSRISCEDPFILSLNELSEYAQQCVATAYL